MATRQRKTPVLDQLRDARAELDRVNKRIRNHGEICSQCHTAGEHTEKLCDQGWELAKKLARATAAVRRCQDAAPPADAQVTLW